MHLIAFLTYIYAPLYCSYAAKKPNLSVDKLGFFECDVGLRPMMTASPDNVCLRAHWGKHRIIASETSNIILSEAKNIISHSDVSFDKLTIL